MTNTAKLRGRIAEKGFTMTSLADAMGLSRPTLRKKIYNLVDFTASEIMKICDILDIEISEVVEYFFNQNVPILET